MSWVVGDHDFEQPAFDPVDLPFPDLKLRVAFIAGQQIAYGGQLSLSKGKRDYFHRLFLKQADRFSGHFRDKVEYIYYCRPAPASVKLKRSTEQSLKVKIDPSKLIKATKEDEEKLDGIKGMFNNYSSSSDSE